MKQKQNKKEEKCTHDRVDYCWCCECKDEVGYCPDCFKSLCPHDDYESSTN